MYRYASSCHPRARDLARDNDAGENKDEGFELHIEAKLWRQVRDQVPSADAKGTIFWDLFERQHVF